MNLEFILNSGKNIKIIYYFKHWFLCALPRYFFQYNLKFILQEFEGRNDKEYILSRVNYYNKLASFVDLSAGYEKLKDNKPSKKISSVYFYDSQIIAKYFDANLKWFTCFGDVIFVPENPAIVKSRPLHVNNENSIVLKLEKIRHFVFLKDKKPFNQKMNKVIFRGKIEGKQPRIDFVKQFFNHTNFDIGNVGKSAEFQQFKRDKMTLWKHLDYKFIMALEGNDVASNLKWVMSSNSIAVMPKPTCETWFMEGTLIPNYHYIEIKNDFSDIEERIQYFINNPEKAQEIVKNANQYTKQFLDKKREKLISVLVLKKYFQKTNQL